MCTHTKNIYLFVYSFIYSTTYSPLPFALKMVLVELKETTQDNRELKVVISELEFQIKQLKNQTGAGGDGPSRTLSSALSLHEEMQDQEWGDQFNGEVSSSPPSLQREDGVLRSEHIEASDSSALESLRNLVEEIVSATTMDQFSSHLALRCNVEINFCFVSPSFSFF